MSSFTAQVDKWVLETKERMEAVFKTGVQITINQALNNTPVDTGFLKSSMQATTTGFLPLVNKPNGAIRPTATVELAIAGLELGETLYANYTANYAIYVENGAKGRQGRHMVKLAAQNWQANINQAITQVRS